MVRVLGPESLGPAAHDDDAVAAAPLLDNFVSGLRATHDGSFHSTVVSHSYGTAVAVEAASHGRTLDVDDVVFVASPGVTVDHASDLHLSGGHGHADHVYATTAKYDSPSGLAEGIDGAVPVHWTSADHFSSNPIVDTGTSSGGTPGADTADWGYWATRPWVRWE